jgi:predicted ATPase/class 3 adenylate cyclase
MQAEAVGLPTGMVTFLFTDIEGSTRQLRRHGAEAYGAVADRHDALLRAAWQAHSGVELGTEGDAFFVAFDDPREALAAAVTAQRGLGQLTWPGGDAVRVRIGIHSGYARPVHGDYRALAVNQTARVMSCAHGGQIFTTRRTLDLVEDRVDDLAVSSLGRFRVRDFPTPTELYEVTAPGVVHIDVAPRVRPAEGHNIVRPTTSLVGRTAELDAIADQLAPGTLQSVVGPGGVGKTRLAVEVAIRVADQWPDGVWFIDLAPLGPPADVAAATAAIVGAPSMSASEPASDLIEHLRDRTELLLFDNCEHVLTEVGVLVNDIRRCAPGVGVLATSRRPLGLADERVVRVAPLPVTDADTGAIALFRDRAGPLIGDPDDSVVAELCVELDGLPLAIELAAARASVASPSDILRQLRDAPRLMRSRDPALPERQRSLDRLLEWSEALLPESERRMLHRLSLAPAGFDIDMAAALCPELEPVEAAEAVWNLADASLLALDPTAGETRYRLLATVRAYADRRLDDGQRRETGRALADELLDRVGPHRGIDQAWTGTMSLEIDNVRHVIEVLASSGDVADVERAQALAWSIGRYHDDVSQVRVGIDEVDRWIDLLVHPSPPRVALLTRSADLHLRVADLERAELRVSEAELLAMVGAPDWDQAGVVRVRCDLALRRGDYQGALAMAREGLTATSDARSRSRLLNVLGIVHLLMGDLAEAVAAQQAAIEASTDAGMATDVANAHSNLAEVLLQVGDERGVAQHQLACLEHARAAGIGVLVAFSVIVAAFLSASRRDWARAVRLHRAGRCQLDELSYVLYESDAERGRRLESDARQFLGADEFDAAAAAGAALGLDAAADDAADQLLNVAAGRAADAAPGEPDQI